VAWYFGLVIKGIVTTIANTAAIPQEIMSTFLHRQKKFITSARFRGLMFSVEISSLLFALDVIVKSIVLGSKLLIKRSQMLKILCDALKKLVLYQHKPIRGLKT
jgi:hypothetical protein